MNLHNLYYKRTAAVAKACYICYKPSTTVLATLDTTDFLYTCTLHLSDQGFATRVFEPESENKIGPSLEEIAKIKLEWEERQNRKKEKFGKVEEDKTDDEHDNKSDKSSKVPGSLPTSGSSTPKPTHEKYILHRDIFALRVSEHRRRRQTSQAKDLAPRLPGAPSRSLS